MARSNSDSPVAIDLFCGAGGLSTGLQEAGFRIGMGVDLDPNAVATYAANHPTTPVYQKDVTSLRAIDIYRAAGTDDITLVAGGPSCQGFSTHGKRDKNDPRNFLFKEFVRLVRAVRPQFFVMENVRGLLDYSGGHYKEMIGKAFGAAGYRVISHVLCAADYGVPQLRHRIFFIGSRLDLPLSMPRPTHGPSDTLLFDLMPYVSVQDAIGDLPLLEGDFRRESSEYASRPASDFQRYARRYVRSKYVTLHHANGLSPQAMRIARHLTEGQGLRSVPVNRLPERFRRMRTISDGSLRRDCTTLYYRLDRNRPAYTITCYFRNVASGPFLHPLENRSLSNREAARLMSFRDSYEFRGTGLPRQIGNAVPPLLANAVGSHLLRILAGEQTHEENQALIAV